MRQIRIAKIEPRKGKVVYAPQQKTLFWWTDLNDYTNFNTEEEALEWVKWRYNSETKYTYHKI